MSKSEKVTIEDDDDLSYNNKNKFNRPKKSNINILDDSNRVLNSSQNIQKYDVNKTSLIQYINKNKCEYGDKTFTHTWWSGDGNIIFKIAEENYEEFIKIYMNDLKFNFGKLHVMEKPLDVGPLCLDYDRII